MALLASNHLMVSTGNQIYVSIPRGQLRIKSLFTSLFELSGEFFTVGDEEVDKGCDERRQPSLPISTESWW